MRITTEMATVFQEDKTYNTSLYLQTYHNKSNNNNYIHLTFHFDLSSIHWQDCFGTEFFEACIQALQLHEEMEKFVDWRDQLGKK